MALRRSHTRAPGARRLTEWIDITLGPSAIAANTQVLVGVGNALLLAARPFTIVRTRFLCSWGTDQNAATERPFGAVGMMIVSDTAATLGVTAIPDPITSADGNWFVWQPMIYDYLFLSLVGSQIASTQYTVDSKAMRKVGADENLVVTVANADAADGAEFTMVGRLLIKIH